MTSQLHCFRAKSMLWGFVVPKLILLFTTAGWSAQPFSINFVLKDSIPFFSSTGGTRLAWASAGEGPREANPAGVSRHWKHSSGGLPLRTSLDLFERWGLAWLGSSWDSLVRWSLKIMTSSASCWRKFGSRHCLVALKASYRITEVASSSWVSLPHSWIFTAKIYAAT